MADDNAFSPEDIYGIYEGTVEADAFYVGSTEVWPLEPRLIHEAKFDPSAVSLYANTGRAGGVFSPRPPLVQARSPYGAYFPARVGMLAPVQKSHWGYTMAGWVKATAPVEDGVVMSLGDVGNSSVGFLNIIHSSDATRRVYLLTRHGGVRPPSIVAPNYAGIGTWLHVAATLEYLSAGAVVKFYVNGALIGTQALEVAGEYMENMTLDLGGDWEGDMGLVHFYDRPLDLAGIKGIYNDERGIYGLPENPGVGNPFFEAVPLYLYGAIPRYESTLGTITVPRAMTVDINLQIAFRMAGAAQEARVTVNGATVTAGVGGGNTAIVSIRRTVAAGAVIAFKQYNNVNLASYRFIDDGYYNVTEVHL